MDADPSLSASRENGDGLFVARAFVILCALKASQRLPSVCSIS